MPNHLIHSHSPYLLQHANNPINWYPWGNEALQKASKENKPIFLSIGYSSCHWCHVMQKESFENDHIAKILNKHFISIKVDKEERPDIDKHFQAVYRLMNGKSGGWPTSIFLTPNLKPFYSATYIPPIAKYGMMPFDELLHLIAKKYAKDEQLLKAKGQEVLTFLNPQKTTIQATRLDNSIATRFISQAKQLFDTKHGGFGKPPKFPQVSTYQTLLALHKLHTDPAILPMITLSLDAMARGGFYDRIDGGFCRYSTDEAWLIPHFEKMGYDNALLCELYLDVYKETKSPHYLEIAQKSIDFFIANMSQNGLFFAASDADTEGVEGEYFVFTKNEIQNAWMEALIPKKDIDTLLDVLEVTKNGNFEGKNIITTQDSALAESLPFYTQAIDALAALRAKRVYPFIDKKIITAWNSMMIKTLFKASVSLPNYLESAKKSLHALLETLYLDGKLYHTTLYGNTPTIEAFLEDYAYLIDALIEAHQATLDKTYLDIAQDLANEAIRKFYKNKKWYFSQGDFQTKADIYDSSYPSSLSVMLEALLKLHSLQQQEYLHIVFDSLQMVSYDVMRQPISSPKLALVVMELLYGFYQLKTPLEASKQQKLSFRYPFVLAGTSLDEKWSLCNEQKCFLHTNNIDEIATFLDRTP